MTATVEQGVDGSLLIPDEDGGFIRDLHQEIIPGIGDGISMSGENPLPVPDVFQIEVEEDGMGVKGALQTPALLLTRDDFCGRSGGYSLS